MITRSKNGCLKRHCRNVPNAGASDNLKCKAKARAVAEQCLAYVRTGGYVVAK